jgi:hypothetical protein
VAAVAAVAVEAEQAGGGGGGSFGIVLLGATVTVTDCVIQTSAGGSGAQGEPAGQAVRGEPARPEHSAA